MSFLGNRFVVPTVTTLAFIFTVILNALGSTGVIGGKPTGEISDKYPTYFTPDGWAFSIWGLIYFLIAVYIVTLWVLALRNKPNPFFWCRVGLLLPINLIFNGLWMVFWQYEVWTLTIILMAGILGTLIAMYVRARVNYLPGGWSRQTRSCSGTEMVGLSTFEYWVLQSTISVYLGWISVATIANVSIFIKVMDADAPSIGTGPGWAIGMMVVAAILALLQLRNNGDFLYSAVIVWALFAIASKQVATVSVHAVALALAWLVLTLLILQVLYLIVLKIGVHHFRWSVSDRGVAAFGAAAAANRHSNIGSSSHSNTSSGRSPSSTRRKRKQGSGSNRA